MKVSYNWLKEFVDLDLDPDHLAEKLTMAGAEVESVERIKIGKFEDRVLDIDVTPNRPDLLSVRGTAREVAALTGRKLKVKKTAFPETGPPIGKLTAVTVRDFSLCPRYCARLIRGVKVGPSPDRIQARLLAGGIKPVNNVVDATNYVLLELGHPLHAFDYEKLEGGKIVVRRAEKGERIATIDGIDRPLSPDVLVIADAAKPVAVAGVMGGVETEIGDSTASVLLESAFFDPVSVRRTSRQLSLGTEASRRFERTADPEAAPEALDRAAALIRELAGGEIAQGSIDKKKKPFRGPLVRIRPSRASDLLGRDCSAETIEENLKKLGLEPAGRSKGSISFRVPTWRPDLRREADLIEEVARLSGYDRIKPELPVARMVCCRKGAEEETCDRAKDILRGLGLDEVITYNFLDPRVFTQLQLDNQDPLRAAPEIENPVNKEQRLLRTTLLPGLFGVVERNLNQNLSRVEIFELGAVFTAGPASPTPRERKLLSLVICRREEKDSWRGPPAPPDFYSLKGIVELLLERLGIDDFSFVPAEHPALQPGRGARLLIGGKEAGIVGAGDEIVLENFSLPAGVYLAEIELDPILSRPRKSAGYRKLPQYPAASRDIAIIVGEDVPYGRVREAVEAARPDILESYHLFDLYRGSPIPANKKSFAFGLKYRSPHDTLSEGKVSKIHQAFQKSLIDSLGCSFRE